MSFHELISGKRDLIGIGIDITQKCNRSCPICYVQCDFKNMHFELFRKIVDEGAVLGFSELYLLGGEPTLHPEILEFIDYVKSKFRLVIFKNMPIAYLNQKKLQHNVFFGRINIL